MDHNTRIISGRNYSQLWKGLLLSSFLTAAAYATDVKAENSVQPPETSLTPLLSPSSTQNSDPTVLGFIRGVDSNVVGLYSDSERDQAFQFQGYSEGKNYYKIGNGVTGVTLEEVVRALQDIRQQHPSRTLTLFIDAHGSINSISLRQPATKASDFMQKISPYIRKGDSLYFENCHGESYLLAADQFLPEGVFVGVMARALEANYFVNTRHAIQTLSTTKIGSLTAEHLVMASLTDTASPITSPILSITTKSENSDHPHYYDMNKGLESVIRNRTTYLEAISYNDLPSIHPYMNQGVYEETKELMMRIPLQGEIVSFLYTQAVNTPIFNAARVISREILKAHGITKNLSNHEVEEHIFFGHLAQLHDDEGMEISERLDFIRAVNAGKVAEFMDNYFRVHTITNDEDYTYLVTSASGDVIKYLYEHHAVTEQDIANHALVNQSGDALAFALQKGAVLGKALIYACSTTLNHTLLYDQLTSIPNDTIQHALQTKNELGQTALMIVSENLPHMNRLEVGQYYLVLEYMLNQGADWYSRDYKGKSPAEYLAQYNSQVENPDYDLLFREVVAAAPKDQQLALGIASIGPSTTRFDLELLVDAGLDPTNPQLADEIMRKALGNPGTDKLTLPNSFIFEFLVDYGYNINHKLQLDKADQPNSLRTPLSSLTRENSALLAMARSIGSLNAHRKARLSMNSILASADRLNNTHEVDEEGNNLVLLIARDDGISIDQLRLLSLAGFDLHHTNTQGDNLLSILAYHYKPDLFMSAAVEFKLDPTKPMKLGNHQTTPFDELLKGLRTPDISDLLHTLNEPQLVTKAVNHLLERALLRGDATESRKYIDQYKGNLNADIGYGAPLYMRVLKDYASSPLSDTPEKRAILTLITDHVRTINPLLPYDVIYPSTEDVRTPGTDGTMRPRIVPDTALRLTAKIGDFELYSACQKRAIEVNPKAATIEDGYMVFIRSQKWPNPELYPKILALAPSPEITPLAEATLSILEGEPNDLEMVLAQLDTLRTDRFISGLGRLYREEPFKDELIQASGNARISDQQFNDCTAVVLRNLGMLYSNVELATMSLRQDRLGNAVRIALTTLPQTLSLDDYVAALDRPKKEGSDIIQRQGQIDLSELPPLLADGVSDAGKKYELLSIITDLALTEERNAINILHAAQRAALSSDKRNQVELYSNEGRDFSIIIRSLMSDHSDIPLEQRGSEFSKLLYHKIDEELMPNQKKLIDTILIETPKLLELEEVRNAIDKYGTIKMQQLLDPSPQAGYSNIRPTHLFLTSTSSIRPC